MIIFFVSPAAIFEGFHFDNLTLTPQRIFEMIPINAILFQAHEINAVLFQAHDEETNHNT